MVCHTKVRTRCGEITDIETTAFQSPYEVLDCVFSFVSENHLVMPCKMEKKIQRMNPELNVLIDQSMAVLKRELMHDWK
jgi:hypothetical protein